MGLQPTRTCEPIMALSRHAPTGLQPVSMMAVDPARKLLVGNLEPRGKHLWPPLPGGIWNNPQDFGRNGHGSAGA